MKRRMGGLAGALVLATFGTFALVSYVQAAKEKAVAGERLGEVFVVVKPIAKGTRGTELEGLVKATQVPVKTRAEGAVTRLASLNELVAGVDLVPGEQLIASRFVTPQAAAFGAEVPKDKLLVTVALEPERALGGQVRVGDRVAVLSSFDPFETGPGQPQTPNTTQIILHKVLVTSVQSGGTSNQSNQDEAKSEAGRANAARGGAGLNNKVMVTLALDAPAVEEVVFTAEHGFLWLSAEPADAPEEGTKIVTRGNVYA